MIGTPAPTSSSVRERLAPRATAIGADSPARAMATYSVPPDAAMSIPVMKHCCRALSQVGAVPTGSVVTCFPLRAGRSTVKVVPASWTPSAGGAGGSSTGWFRSQTTSAGSGEGSPSTAPHSGAPARIHAMIFWTPPRPTPLSSRARVPRNGRRGGPARHPPRIQRSFLPRVSWRLLGSQTRSAARAVADVARRLGQPSGCPVLVDVVRVGLEVLDRLLIERAVRVQDRVERPVHHDADAHLVLGHVGEHDVRRNAVARSRRADVGVRIPAVDRMAVRVLSESAPRGIRRGVRRADLGGRPDRTRRYTRKLLAAVADAVDQLLDAEIVLLLAEEHLVPDDAVANRGPERLGRLLGLDDAVVVDAVGDEGVALAQDQRPIRLLVVATDGRIVPVPVDVDVLRRQAVLADAALLGPGAGARLLLAQPAGADRVGRHAVDRPLHRPLVAVDGEDADREIIGRVPDAARVPDRVRREERGGHVDDDVEADAERLVVAVGDRRAEELEDLVADGPADRRRAWRGPAVFRVLGDQPALLLAEVPEGRVSLVAHRQLRDDVVVARPELVLEVVHGAAGGKIDEEAARVLRRVAELLVVAAVHRAVEARVAGGTGLRARLIAAGRRRVPVRPAFARARGGGGVVGVVAGVRSLELPRPLEPHSRVPAGAVVAAEVVVELGGDVPLAAVVGRDVVVIELIGVLEPDDHLGETIVDLGVRPDLPRPVVDTDAPPALDGVEIRPVRILTRRLPQRDLIIVAPGDRVGHVRTEWCEAQSGLVEPVHAVGVERRRPVDRSMEKSGDGIVRRPHGHVELHRRRQVPVQRLAVGGVVLQGLDVSRIGERIFLQRRPTAAARLELGVGVVVRRGRGDSDQQGRRRSQRHRPGARHRRSLPPLRSEILLRKPPSLCASIAPRCHGSFRSAAKSSRRVRGPRTSFRAMGFSAYWSRIFWTSSHLIAARVRSGSIRYGSAAPRPRMPLRIVLRGSVASWVGSSTSPSRPHGRLYVALASSDIWKARRASISPCRDPPQRAAVPHTTRFGPT